MYNILKSLITSLPAFDSKTEAFLGHPVYIKEYKTIKLSVARGIGKTTAIAKLAKEYSYLVLVPNYSMAEDYRLTHRVHASSSVYSIIDRTRGVYNKGPKYRGILIDEGFYMPDISILTAHLQISGLLEQDYFILYVGTDTK